jgi:hypothetical protein
MSSSSSSRRFLRIFGFLLLVSAVPAEDSCDAEGSCGTSDGPGPTVHSSHSSSTSGVCGGSNYLYGDGGTAQAYKPGAPLSSVVCRPEMAHDFKYQAASWPFSRRSLRKGSAPSLDVTLNIWECKSSEDNECSCQRLKGAAVRNASSVVEVWQTLPDGQYSPLRPSVASLEECRAQVPFTEKGVASFSTVAPGSTGIMGGLGPGGWEWNPYGPPVIHLLVQVAGHTPLLLDLPVLPHAKTLEQRTFSIGDFRGAAWVQQRPKEVPMKITSWKPNVKDNRISLEVDIYVQQSSEDMVQLCQSAIYGFPSSFFLEPIAVCAPSLLDFFAL